LEINDNLTSGYGLIVYLNYLSDLRDLSGVVKNYLEDRINLNQNLVDFTRMWVVSEGVSDCEELSGGYSQEMMVGVL
jgi:hypothetical protein